MMNPAGKFDGEQTPATDFGYKAGEENISPSKFKCLLRCDYVQNMMDLVRKMMEIVLKSMDLAGPCRKSSSGSWLLHSQVELWTLHYERRILH